MSNQWKEISAFVASGHARYGGVSQFCDVALAALEASLSPSGYRPAINQVRFVEADLFHHHHHHYRIIITINITII